MKKYIAPIAKSVNLESESLIALSTGVYGTEDVSVMSNGRESASSSIWGED